MKASIARQGSTQWGNATAGNTITGIDLQCYTTDGDAFSTVISLHASLPADPKWPALMTNDETSDLQPNGFNSLSLT